MIATRVGHFPETIQHGYNGYIAEPDDLNSMAAQILKFMDQPIDRENVKAAAAKMRWDRYAAAILNEKIV